MADQMIKIIIGLLTTLIGYFIGRLWQKIRDEVPRRRARVFWGPVLKGKTTIVVSRVYSKNEFPDPAGYAGGGDAFALREVMAYLAFVGLKDFDVRYVDEPDPHTKGNLILLGGPDSNKLTRAVLNVISPRAGVKVVDPGAGELMEVHDSVEGESYVAQFERDPSGGFYSDSGMDYGIIVRAKNPFDENGSLIVIAGAYGYGSWGGALLAKDEVFLARCRKIEEGAVGSGEAGKKLRLGWIGEALHFFGDIGYEAPLESIFSVGVYNKRPVHAEILDLRETRKDPEQVPSPSIPHEVPVYPPSEVLVFSRHPRIRVARTIYERSHSLLAPKAVLWWNRIRGRG